MKIFILEDVDKLTSAYHSNGGLVIVAESLERAKAIAREKGDTTLNGELVTEVTQEEWANAICYSCDATEERMLVFPDAGCC